MKFKRCPKCGCATISITSGKEVEKIYKYGKKIKEYKYNLPKIIRCTNTACFYEMVE